MGEDEPELRRDLMTAKDAFDARMVETQAELGGALGALGRWRWMLVTRRVRPRHGMRWWRC